MTNTMDQKFTTGGGIEIVRHVRQGIYEDGTSEWTQRLDTTRGAIFSSNYEYPGRYTRWDTATANPPLMISSKAQEVTFRALNDRGKLLLDPIGEVLEHLEEIESCEKSDFRIEMKIIKPTRIFREEERSRQPTVFTVIRKLIELFSCDDPNLGLYGAFGYDLAFQFEPIKLKHQRGPDQRDLVLYLPDEVLVVDHHARKSTVFSYEFLVKGQSSFDLSNESEPSSFIPANHDPSKSDHNPGEYAELVKKAVKYFERGDLFEVVPGQTFAERSTGKPSKISLMLTKTNPSPYSFFINLGDNEFLIGASPEMYVRVTGRRVETCPISGTISRGRNAIEDEVQIRKLLNSKKDEAELTMCSDVDRNDKSRICEPGSVRVLGRRQIEMYSRLIHTVDHIEGILRPEMDALDAFLSHAWAVTVTGAPKRWAMQFIEDHEKSARAWYGGAIGMIHFTGELNTGLTLRTVRLKNGIAEVRAGATLLYDSIPEEEEEETELKASAMLAAIRDAGKLDSERISKELQKIGEGKTILLIDHEDSSVHTLANYFRQTGATVVTYRMPVNASQFDEVCPDLVIFSPGPGRPTDFDCASAIELALSRNLPIFGVCLGLQALCEYYGGALGQLDTPMHGKPSSIIVNPPSKLFAGMDSPVTMGLYHSLFALTKELPKEFRITAQNEEGVPMAIEHDSLPLAAVQFHPESIMSLNQDVGHQIVANVIENFAGKSTGEFSTTT